MAIGLVGACRLFAAWRLACVVTVSQNYRPDLSEALQFFYHAWAGILVATPYRAAACDVTDFEFLLISMENLLPHGKTACGEQHDLVVLPLSTSKERWSYVESRIYKVGQDPNSEKWSLFTMWRLSAMRKYTLRNLKLRQRSRSISIVMWASTAPQIGKGRLSLSEVAVHVNTWEDVRDHSILSVSTRFPKLGESAMEISLYYISHYSASCMQLASRTCAQLLLLHMQTEEQN